MVIHILLFLSGREGRPEKTAAALDSLPFHLVLLFPPAIVHSRHRFGLRSVVPSSVGRLVFPPLSSSIYLACFFFMDSLRTRRFSFFPVFSLLLSPSTECLIVLISCAFALGSGRSLQ